MIRAGPDEKLYPVAKLTAVVEALVAEGVPLAEALHGTALSKGALSSPKTRVSLNQILKCYRNASELSSDPLFAYRAGLRFHVSTYGMYGFAILSSVDFRQTMRFAVGYHRLACPTADIEFQEAEGSGVWTITPLAHPHVDAALYRFLVGLQLGIHMSLHRDVMGPSFVAQEVHVTYGSIDHAKAYPAALGCKLLFGQPANELMFDAGWLDGTPLLGNEITYSHLAQLCDELLEELQLRGGLAGKVREILLVNLAHATRFNQVARHLAMTPRTLRRKLREEKTSYRALLDELRMHVAIKYLRDTRLKIDDITDSLGFSEAATFRHAFHRWTGKAPQDFRRISGRLRRT